jgi:pimeloyl-ACP methyl ester carboxylesterase
VLALIGCTIIIAALGFVALRDNPARPVIGEPREADNHGVILRYYVSGPDDREVVVLLPSYARSGSDFNELVERVNLAGHRTLVLQARGIDGTELPGYNLTLFDYADDLAAVLDHEALLAPVVLIGHAFGNRIARSFASRYPARVRSLVLLAAGDGGPPADVRNDIFKILLSFLPQSTRSGALHRAFFAPDNRAPDYWMTGWYPRAQDAAAPRGAEKLKQLYPDRVKIVNLENAGHAILPEQPKEIARIVLGHLESQRSER